MTEIVREREKERKRKRQTDRQREREREGERGGWGNKVTNGSSRKNMIFQRRRAPMKIFVEKKLGQEINRSPINIHNIDNNHVWA